MDIRVCFLFGFGPNENWLVCIATFHVPIWSQSEDDDVLSIDLHAHHTLNLGVPVLYAPLETQPILSSNSYTCSFICSLFFIDFFFLSFFVRCFCFVHGNTCLYAVVFLLQQWHLFLVNNLIFALLCFDDDACFSFKVDWNI